MMWIPLAACQPGLYAAHARKLKEDPDPGTDPPLTYNEYLRTKVMKNKPKKPKGGKKPC